MLWEVTVYCHAHPVRHYEAEDINPLVLMIVIEIIYVFAKVVYLCLSRDGFSEFILLVAFPILKSLLLGSIGIAVFAQVRTSVVLTDIL